MKNDQRYILTIYSNSIYKEVDVSDNTPLFLYYPGIG